MSDLISSYSFDVDALIIHLHTAAVIVQDFAIIAGIFLIYAGFMKFKRYGEMRTMMSSQMTMAEPLMLVVCGSLLMFTPYLLGSAMEAFWSTVNPLSYMPGSSEFSDKMMRAIFMFLRLLGVGVFIKGWMMMAKSGSINSQPGMRGKAAMHLFIGVLLMHFLGTEHLLMEALGFSTAL